MMRTLETTARAEIDAIIARLKDEPGPLLLVLHAVQDALGYIPAAAVPVIADGLNLSRAEVHGVRHLLSLLSRRTRRPPHRPDLPRRGVPVDGRRCAGRACQAASRRRLPRDHAGRRFTLEPVYCLGNCACSPAVMIDRQRCYGRVTPQRFDELLAEWEEGSMSATVYVPRDASALVARRRRSCARHPRAMRARHGSI